MYKEFKRYWDEVKSNYKYGTQYIDMETDEYIVICPFTFKVICDLDLELYHNCKFSFSHCVCHSWGAFELWYKLLYEYGRVKAFFIRKDIDLDIDYHNQPLTAEFTGWVDFSDRDFLHFVHLVNNHAATGYYGEGSKFACEECAFSKNVDFECKEIVEEINNVLSQVVDELDGLYETYVDNLEDTLHKFLHNE